ncbi:MULTISPECIES: hypothetical protein [Shewanella]|uniref:Uncharacterized protein n=1 Tax=Shewanella vesiculosa TaxID=518738 RepID=A0ABV0FLN8_9GAMM|nr:MULTISPECIES: hypothetical protein [Shewanella]NCQ43556.1 hypothetical protein [Shewanella frigidimarina]MBB1390024.1 hypothetical protein [Shewanella sp. SG44-6]NCO69930.1 hypothetical protein [Shewanella vesiculosa]NCP35470.1 hypothetical protein [Shewanella vesiculosa]NCP68051.1 hypothetical protein [Shewanella vesiculosa]
MTANKQPAISGPLRRQSSIAKNRIGKHHKGASEGHNIADKEQAQKP